MLCVSVCMRDKVKQDIVRQQEKKSKEDSEMSVNKLLFIIIIISFGMISILSILLIKIIGF